MEEDESFADVGMEGYNGTGESDIEGRGSDDSEDDPTYGVLQETRSALSELALKKSKSRSAKEISSSDEESLHCDGKVPKLDEKDEKCFEKVEELIRDGHLEKLKVDQCKVYLRKYGLRLTGKKEVLIQRIREHLGFINGGGEEKYPTSSFVVNCKGDACTGDVVMFEQNVYDMYSVVSRSATAPPCGTRTVIGRIVKESYGAAKQQHTFTIEVLWSKGQKPLPPLHPLLIKGRNLYRLKTMRQRWIDEEERKKGLLEKHTRGNLARSSREIRIQAKERRRMRTDERAQITGGRKTQDHHRAQETETNKPVKSQQPIIDGRYQSVRVDSIHPQPTSYTTQKRIATISVDNGHKVHPVNTTRRVESQLLDDRHHWEQPVIRSDGNQPLQAAYCIQPKAIPPIRFDHPRLLHYPRECREQNYASSVSHLPTSQCRQPLANLNSFYSRSPHRSHVMKNAPCRYYREGRCRYGHGCRWLHE